VDIALGPSQFASFVLGALDVGLWVFGFWALYLVFSSLFGSEAWTVELGAEGVVSKQEQNTKT
jgi:hypothetical protein